MNAISFRALFNRYRDFELVNFFRTSEMSKVFKSPTEPHLAAERLGLHPTAVKKFCLALVSLKALEEFGSGKFVNAGYELVPDSNFESFCREMRSFHALQNSEVMNWLIGGAGPIPPSVNRVLESYPTVDSSFIRYHVLILNQFLQREVIQKCLEEGISQAHSALCMASSNLFENYTEKPAVMRIFLDGLSAINLPSNTALISQLPIRTGDSFLDIGSGDGSFLGLLGRHFPNIGERWSYDLPDAGKVLRPLRQIWDPNRKVAEAFGSFFTNSKHLDGLPIDKQFDWIALSWILHDWNIDECVQILQRASEHLSVDGRIVVIEFVMDVNSGVRVPVVDFFMYLIMERASERTLPEFQDIFNTAGLKFESIVHSDGGRSLMILRIAEL